MDDILNSTLSGTSSDTSSSAVNTKAKVNNVELRKRLVDVMERRKDPNFTRSFLFSMGFDLDSIDTELTNYLNVNSGRPSNQNPNTVTIDGRTHEINTMAEEKIYQDIKTAGAVDQNQKNSLLSSVNSINSILEDDKYKAISGAAGGAFAIPFTEGWQTASDFESTVSDLKLAARSALKGSGTISDYEMKVLEKAAGEGVSRLSSEDDFKKQLVEIRGALATSAGLAAPVRISKNGESKIGPATRQEIMDAIADGCNVEFYD